MSFQGGKDTKLLVIFGERETSLQMIHIFPYKVVLQRFTWAVFICMAGLLVYNSGKGITAQTDPLTKKDSLYLKLSHPDKDTLAKTYILLSQQYLIESRLDSADHYLQLSLPLIRKGSLLNANWLDSKGIVLMAQGELTPALQHFQQALFICDKLGEKGLKKKAIVKINEGKAYTQLNYLYKAIASYQTALDIFRDIPQNQVDTSLLSLVYNNTGAVYFYENKLDKAQEYYDKARTLAVMQHGKDHPSVGQALYNIGLVRETKGYYTDAIYFYEQALAIYKKRFGEHHQLIAEAYGGLGSAYLNRKEPDRAIYYFEKDLATVRQLYGSDHPDMAWGYESLGWAYLTLQKQDTAISLLQKSLALRKQAYNGPHTEIADNLLLLAEAYNLPEKSIPLTEQALKTEELVTHSPTFTKANALLQLSEWSEQSGKLQEALRWTDSSLAILNKLVSDGKHPNLAQARLRKSALHLKMDELEMAYAWADKAMEATTEPSFRGNERNEDITVHLLFEQEYLQCLLAKTDIQQAYFNQTKDIVHRERILSLAQSALPVIARIQYLQTSEDAGPATDSLFRKMYQTGMIQALALHQHFGKDKYLETAFAFAERIKNGSLSNTVRSLDLLGVANIPESTIRRDYQLKKDIRYIKSMMEDTDDQTEQYSSLQETLHNLYLEQERFLQNMRRFHPEYFKMKYHTDPVGREHLQEKLLGKNDLMMHLTKIDDQIIVWAIGKNIFQHKQFDSRHWKLESIFWEIGKLPGIQNIIWIPDASMEDIYPESVKIDGRYMLEKYSFIYNSSASLYARKPLHDKAFNHQILAFAPVTFNVFGLPDLRHSEEEVKEINKYMDIEPYLKEKATKKQFMSELNDHSVIHLATHADMNQASPMKSALYFYPVGQKDSAVVYAHELFGQPMRAHLVTLSACRTAEQGGLLEGASGIAAAFAYNGCRNILMSLWDVDDKATKEIMTGFYRYLAEGKDKAAALRLSKLDYLKNTDRYGKDPKYWAGIILAGDHQPFHLGKPKWAIHWWIPALLAFVAAMLYNRRWWLRLRI